MQIVVRIVIENIETHASASGTHDAADARHSHDAHDPSRRPREAPGRLPREKTAARRNVVNVVEKRASVWTPPSGKTRGNCENRGDRRADDWQAWENAESGVKTRGRRGKT